MQVRSRWWRVFAAVAVVVLLASVSVVLAQSPERLWQEKAEAAPPADIARLNDFLHHLAERLKPFLVQVRVSRAVESPAEGEGGTPEGRRASGSGFLIRQDGYLVTNAHVVTEAERIQVKLSDGRRFEGRLVGQDDRVDLALVKIEATGLPVADLGDSNRLRVGELVLALGHPFGLEQTVSFGIVSRKGAPLEVAAAAFEFIQTDAAINPGNSGGPLVSMAGEVIGVNSMAARNGSIGFAIPINLVKGLLPQLAEKGKVEWGWLGVSIAEVADEDVARYRLKEPRGVLVRQVVAGQPADKGGVKANDVILGVDGARVNEPRDLQRIIFEHAGRQEREALDDARGPGDRGLRHRRPVRGSAHAPASAAGRPAAIARTTPRTFTPRGGRVRWRGRGNGSSDHSRLRTGHPSRRSHSMTAVSSSHPPAQPTRLRE